MLQWLQADRRGHCHRAHRSARLPARCRGSAGGWPPPLRPVMPLVSLKPRLCRKLCVPEPESLGMGYINTYWKGRNLVLGTLKRIFLFCWVALRVAAGLAVGGGSSGTGVKSPKLSGNCKKTSEKCNDGILYIAHCNSPRCFSTKIFWKKKAHAPPCMCYCAISVISLRWFPTPISHSTHLWKMPTFWSRKEWLNSVSLTGQVCCHKQVLPHLKSVTGSYQWSMCRRWILGSTYYRMRICMSFQPQKKGIPSEHCPCEHLVLHGAGSSVPLSSVSAPPPEQRSSTAQEQTGSAAQRSLPTHRWPGDNVGRRASPWGAQTLG